MLFHSLDYAVLLITVGILAWGFLRTRLRLRHLMMLAASYLFYCAWDWRFAGLLVFSTLLDFLVGRAIYEAKSLRRKRQFLVVSLIGNLGVLGFFKYYNFFLDNLNHLLLSFGFSLPGYVEVILPLGISFYTFQTLSYSLDIYFGKLEPTRSLADFALFVAFFPQLIAGPIVRARQFLPQLERPVEFDEDRMISGIYRILKGLVKKVFIADLIGLHLVDPVFAEPGKFGALDSVFAVLGFYMQLGFDFSAYADIAIGSARTLGFELPENFRAAARAVNLAEVAHHAVYVGERLLLCTHDRGAGAQTPPASLREYFLDHDPDRALARGRMDVHCVRSFSRSGAGPHPLVGSAEPGTTPPSQARTGRICVDLVQTNGDDLFRGAEHSLVSGR